MDHYNLDAIIAVGYRVRSHRGTQFRIWATERLREYLVKGFTMDDARLKRAGGGNYFEELLARIRDIRSSERVFWRKVLDIYATSIDYDPAAEASQLFFKTVQNKMHWAAHGHTAAEVIHGRADASQPHMGLTSWAGDRPRKPDVGIAKNYLNADEIDALNRIVTAYLEFAELQAMNRRPMYMADWIAKLDDFLRLSDRDILTHAGKISHDEALLKAESEFDKYRQTQAALPQPVDQHFQQTLDELKKIEKQKKALPKKNARRKGRKPRASRRCTMTPPEQPKEGSVETDPGRRTERMFAVILEKDKDEMTDDTVQAKARRSPLVPPSHPTRRRQALEIPPDSPRRHQRIQNSRRPRGDLRVLSMTNSLRRNRPAVIRRLHARHHYLPKMPLRNRSDRSPRPSFVPSCRRNSRPTSGRRKPPSRNARRRYPVFPCRSVTWEPPARSDQLLFSVARLAFLRLVRFAVTPSLYSQGRAAGVSLPGFPHACSLTFYSQSP